MALLAAYMIRRKEGEPLQDYLANRVFAGNAGSEMAPDAADVEGFEVFAERYKKGIAIEQAALANLI